ncbi:hypothetical protein Cgig2_008430 [Carnegiea gigantea]|uniref:Pentatricopeptide repeat-containing protein n=1 Tax=Carnegiea gigantea TaxID=171969 RepID=A0A9Q1JT14_9CARY|nr:hypothetical protein Cgig2_008430 [Carnegiea gigantea]
MVDILGKLRNFELMWALTEEMHELGGLVSIGTMTKIMRRLSGALKYKAFEKFERFGLVKDISALNILMDTLKDFRKVDEILDEMQPKGCPPNVVSYIVVMLALGKAKDINGSLEFWDRMKRNGCILDANLYNALIYILSKSRRFKDACDLFKDMSKENRMKVLNYLLQDMFRKNVSIDLATYNLLVTALCKNGKLEHACSFFEHVILKGKVPRDSTYKMLVKKLEDKNMPKAKQQIEKLMSDVKKFLGFIYSSRLLVGCMLDIIHNLQIAFGMCMAFDDDIGLISSNDASSSDIEMEAGVKELERVGKRWNRGRNWKQLEA